MPLAKVDGLTPRTEYEARVSLHDDQENGSLGDSTETTRFTTDGEGTGGDSGWLAGCVGHRW